jgi:hypothetical protein
MARGVRFKRFVRGGRQQAGDGPGGGRRQKRAAGEKVQELAPGDPLALRHFQLIARHLGHEYLHWDVQEDRGQWAPFFQPPIPTRRTAGWDSHLCCLRREAGVTHARLVHEYPTMTVVHVALWILFVSFCNTTRNGSVSPCCRCLRYPRWAQKACYKRNREDDDTSHVLSPWRLSRAFLSN